MKSFLFKSKAILKISVCLVLAIVLIVITQEAKATDDTQGDYSYQVNEGGTTCTVTGSEGATGDITIPDTITDNSSDSYTATLIGDNAFSGNTAITSVMIPKSISGIGANAFSGCSNLRSVYFLGNAPIADTSTFLNCAEDFTVYYTSTGTGFDTWNGYTRLVFDPDVTYTVTFHLNGAAGTAPDTQTVYGGVKAACPDTPVCDGKIFGGWFIGSDCKNEDEWNFDTAVTGNTELYAKWEEVQQADFSIEAESGNPSYGSVSGGGTYNNGVTVTLTAVPNSACRFVCWKEAATQVSDTSVYSFTACANKTYTAEFAPIDTPSVSAVSAGYKSINISWSAVDGAAGYEVWQSTSASGTYSKLTALSGISYTDSGISPGKTYYYKVDAYCISATVTTYGSQSAYAAAIPAPLPPALYASSASYKSIKISWNSVPGASGYELSCATSQNGTYKVIRKTSSLSYLNDNLATGTTYFYKARAYRTVGRTKVYSDYSAIVSAQPVLSPVASAAAKAYDTTSVKVSWSSVPGRTKYEVWRSTLPDSDFLPVKTTTGTSFADTDLRPFVTYYYEIKVYRTVNKQNVYSSGSSPTVNATPILDNVLDITAMRSSAGGNKISWASVTGCSGYAVLRSTSVDGEYSEIKSTSETSYTDTNLTPDTTYYYKLAAYRNVGTDRVFSTQSAPVSPTPGSFGLPNIYYFLLDEYGTFDIMSKYYGYDNKELYDFLSLEGFNISKESYSTDNRSWCSLCDTLNLNNIATHFSRSKAENMSRNAPFMKALWDTGYSQFQFSTSTQAFVGITNINSSAGRKAFDDLAIGSGKTGDFVPGDSVSDAISELLKSQPAPSGTDVDASALNQWGFYPSDYIRNTTAYKIHNSGDKAMANTILNIFDFYGDPSTYAADKPHVLYSYFKSPHVPFLFDEYGGIIPYNLRKDWKHKYVYLDQYKFLTKKMMLTISTIINNDPDSIIIFMSDHGVRYHANGIPGSTYHPTQKEQVRIMNAVYIKGQKYNIEGLSSINTLRFILSLYEGMDYAPIKDKITHDSPDDLKGIIPRPLTLDDFE